MVWKKALTQKKKSFSLEPNVEHVVGHNKRTQDGETYMTKRIDLLYAG